MRNFTRPHQEAGDGEERNNGSEQKPDGGPGGKHRDGGQQARQRCRRSHQVEPGDNKSSSKRAGGGLGHIRGQGPHQGPATPSNETCARDLNAEWATGSRPSASGWPPFCTPAATTWPPLEFAPRPRMGGAGNELTALMQGLMGAQANDSGWPTFSGKYVEYPRFRKEWWAYRQTSHGHV